MKEVIILAGGFGMRLRSVVSDLPKPMAPVCGRPFLAYLLDMLGKQGCKHAVLSTGYMHEKIEQYFGDSYQGLMLSYAIEDTPLGTGGGIMNALQCCQGDEVVVMNGDTMFRIDFLALDKFFHSHDTKLTLVLRNVYSAGRRYGSVELASDGRITAFREKSSTSGAGIINGGTFMLHRSLFADCGINNVCKFSFEKELMEAYVAQMPFYGIVCDTYFIDIGVPEDYQRAQSEFKGIMIQ